jgi:prepilin-type N-terminal cleavage/methylation domain-containing protein
MNAELRMLCRNRHNHVISSGVRLQTDEVEKSAYNATANPDFSTPFASLTTVEMTSFLQSKLKTQNSKLKTASHGFTLVELLLALAVSGIVLAAVATLAFALSAAADSSDDTAHKQAQVRYATLRINELIRDCRLICAASSSDLAVWSSDDNGDSQINVNELTYIQKGSASNYIRLCQFPSSATGIVTLSAMPLPDDYIGVKYVDLVPQCSNVQYAVDVSPPRTKFVLITFNLIEDGVSHQYQISTALRCWAGNLLNGDTLVTSDDD